MAWQPVVKSCYATWSKSLPQLFSVSFSFVLLRYPTDYEPISHWGICQNWSRQGPNTYMTYVTKDKVKNNYRDWNCGSNQSPRKGEWVKHKANSINLRKTGETSGFPSVVITYSVSKVIILNILTHIVRIDSGNSDSLILLRVKKKYTQPCLVLCFVIYENDHICNHAYLAKYLILPISSAQKWIKYSMIVL